MLGQKEKRNTINNDNKTRGTRKYWRKKED